MTRLDLELDDDDDCPSPYHHDHHHDHYDDACDGGEHDTIRHCFPLPLTYLPQLEEGDDGSGPFRCQAFHVVANIIEKYANPQATGQHCLVTPKWISLPSRCHLLSISTVLEDPPGATSTGTASMNNNNDEYRKLKKEGIHNRSAQTLLLFILSFLTSLLDWQGDKHSHQWEQVNGSAGYAILLKANQLELLLLSS